MSETSRIDTILAVVVVEEAKAKVAGGSAPVFIVKDKEEQEKIALILSRITKAMAHDLENGVYILVKH